MTARKKAQGSLVNMTPLGIDIRVILTVCHII